VASLREYKRNELSTGKVSPRYKLAAWDKGKLASPAVGQAETETLSRCA
jgi:hypothetical protein